LKPEDKKYLLETIGRLRAGSEGMGAPEAESLFMDVLGPLLKEDGYEISRPPLKGPDRGLDLFANRRPSVQYQGQKIGIEFKYYRSGTPVGVNQVRALIRSAMRNELDRAILLINTQFTKDAREYARREMPLEIELADLDSLCTWADRLEVDQEGLGAEVQQILRVVSRKFAILIAQNPRVLDELEWRDIERTIAEVFEGLGFSATLTPSSKDGGKDVILECTVRGGRAEYVVEIKHWRSGSRVGSSALRSFLNVIVRESRQGGLFLSTYGFCDNAFEQLSAIDRQRLRFGSEEKVVALCRTYVKASSGLWSPPENLAEVLYEETT
jgi:restriction system protein